MNKKVNVLFEKVRAIKRYVYSFVAIFLLAVSYNLFILPNNLVFGGVSGVAVMLKNVIEPSLFIFLVNAILLVISLLVLGKQKTVGTIIGVIIYPLFIKLTSNIGDIIIFENIDLLLTALFAGFLSGAASGTILKYGFSTGGSDVAAQILSKVFKMPTGKAYMIIDGLIIIFGGIYLGLMRVMYAIIILYIHSLLVDKIILGISNNKAFYIITNKEAEVKKFILDNLNHGVTILNAKGGYDGYKANVLLCVVPARHYFKLKEGISSIDDQAFLVVTDAYEVKGGA